MHVCSTRASQCRRQSSANLLAAVLAAAFFWGVAPVQAAPKTGAADEIDATASIDNKAAHEIRLEYVEEGREGLELSARLTETGGLIQKPVFWTVVSLNGETIYKGDAPIANLSAEIGDYEVTARYGTVTVAQTISLIERQRVGLTFVLNVGGLRVLPRIENAGPAQIQAETAIYATSGRLKGRLVAKSTIPGEIVRVGAGSYRVESRFAPGNATASVDVSVEAGMMSAIDLTMAAGIARLSAITSQEQVTWSIADIEGNVLPSIQGTSVEVALTPGRYTALVLIGAKEHRIHFSISSGEIRDVILPN
jgi:hypothetical protein